MTDVTMVKCACTDCVCVINTKDGVEKDKRFYCSTECADGHANGAGCHHAGCTCHG